MLLSVAPTERKVRIEVGYGLEGTLTDALAQVIIASAMVPRFKTNDYTGESSEGSMGSFRCSPQTPRNGTQKRAFVPKISRPYSTFFPILLFLVIVFIFRHMVGSARGPSGTLARSRGRTIFIPYGGPASGGNKLGRRIFMGRLFGRRFLGRGRLVGWRRRIGELVMPLTEHDRTAIAAAIREAEKRTCGQIVCVCWRAPPPIIRQYRSNGRPSWR